MILELESLVLLMVASLNKVSKIESEIQFQQHLVNSLWNNVGIADLALVFCLI